MALNQLVEKLDQVSELELGFEFDEGAVWKKLEQRLDNKKAYAYWWTIAACLLIGFTLLPISLLKETNIQAPTISDQVDVPMVEIPLAAVPEESNVTSPKTMKLRVLNKKEFDAIQLAQVSEPIVYLEPILISKEKKQKPAFAAEDISIIQASLERPSIEKGKSITVRAQLQSFPQDVQTSQKVLKIKLYEKH